MKNLLRWFNRKFFGATEWRWVGDNSGALLERRTTYAEFVVVERVGIDRGDRSCCFSETWQPGALQIPSRIQKRLGEDLAWYVPKDMKLRTMLITGDDVKSLSANDIMQQMSADAEILVGDRVTYWIDIAVEFGGERLASESVNDQDICVDFYNMDEVERITSNRLPDLVKAARMHWFYKARTLAVA